MTAPVDWAKLKASAAKVRKHWAGYRDYAINKAHGDAASRHAIATEVLCELAPVLARLDDAHGMSAAAVRCVVSELRSTWTAALARLKAGG